MCLLNVEDSTIVDELAILELTFKHALNAEGMAIDAGEILVLNSLLEFWFGEAWLFFFAVADVLIDYHSTISIQ